MSLQKVFTPTFPDDSYVERLLSQCTPVEYYFNNLYEDLPELTTFIRSSPHMKRYDTIDLNLKLIEFLKESQDPAFANMKHIIVVKTGFVVLCLTNNEVPDDVPSVTTLFDVKGCEKFPSNTITGRIWESLPSLPGPIDAMGYTLSLSLMISSVALLWQVIRQK